MAWKGYLQFGGTEIINVQRTEQYLRNHGSFWFRPVYKNNSLHQVLDAELYRLPHLDKDTPWTDPNDEDTFGFYGVYPLNVTGIESSSRTSSIVEFSQDGGSAGRVRHGTKQMVFSALLLGRDDAAVDAGLRWLRNALLAGTEGGACDGSEGFGTTLCYYAAEPPWDERYPDCASDYERTLMQVTVTSGPTVQDQRTMTDGCAMWTVEWTAVAGLPYEFGPQETVIQGFPGAVTNTADGVIAGVVPAVAAEVACPVPQWIPMFDPQCPDLIAPPTVPNISFGCFVPPHSWSRRTFTIPASLVPTWSDMVPIIRIHNDQAASRDVRNIRIRLYADASTDPAADPCSFCADLLVSYVPAGGVFVIDGTDETVKFTAQAQTRRADSLVYGSDGSPLEWPQLSCGADYLVVVDMEQTAYVPRIDFFLTPRSR